ncbi:protease pro-enzyme activation domain-containing protein [Tunturiibacter lichenicola]|uniref:S53 family peptidase n=1 Tax=Tunturiibacter lichenicola TaxID=2051959 RepID=UPI003D9BAD1E
MKRICRVVPPFLLMGLLFCSSSAFAQQPTPRLARTIADSARTVLAGSRTPQALRGQDLGPVSPEMAIPGITLVFKRSPEQEDALQQLLTAQQNTASPLYHHWLTPDTFAARFGMADEDIAAAETWLQSRGFHVESIARSRDRITFSGTAAQVQSSFGTGLHYYQVDGEHHFAPAADLTLPTELASVTAAVLHLSNFRPKPSIKLQTRPNPDYTTSATQAHYLAPVDIETMYDLTTLAKNGFTGAGQALAVVGQSYVNTSVDSSEIAYFQTYSGRTTPITPVLVPSSGVEAISPGDQGESEIDLEYASGIASSANIFLVYVGNNQNYDVFDALAFAIDQNIAPVISISYSSCEPLMSLSALDQGNALFEQASAQGQTLVAASGDSGSTACALFTSAGLTPTQQQALSVSYPADSPYVTAVGGTQMAAGTFAAGSNQYWASAGAYDAPNTLLSYVPEVVWNEGSTSFGIAAGGGGTSTHFSRPNWQSGVPGIPSGAFRLLPDIALQSSIADPGFLLCSSDPTLTQGQTSCNGPEGLQGSQGKYTVAGGTSFATPIFAGFLAILNQIEQTNGLGNINPQLYALAANSASYEAAFHDIISGSNACISGTGNCATPGESGYAATPGYDEATGLGSVDFGHLVTAWPSTSTTTRTPTSIQLIPYSVSALPGQSLQVQIMVGYFNSVSPNAQYEVPTGTLAVYVDDIISQPSLPFSSTNASVSNATAIYTFVAPATSGSHLITVTYPGDASHLPAAATTSILVGNVTATGSFTVTAANLTITNGSNGSTQIATTPTGGYGGRVTWSLAATTTNGTAELCYSIGAPSTNNPNAATLTIGVGSACNSPAPAQRANFRPVGSHASSKNQNSSPWGNTQMIMVAGLMVCGSFVTKRRNTRMPLMLTAIILTIASVGLIGCGGSNGGSNGGTSAPPANSTNYTLKLTGTDSVNTTITASTTFTLTVN